MEPLNSPIEVGMRVLALLEQCYPKSLDVDRLALMDHRLIHSADFGGPDSLHPGLPGRNSEVGLKRLSVERGLQVMLRAGLASLDISESGIRYRAAENAQSFISLLDSSYMASIRARAEWVVGNAEISDEELKEEVRTLTNRWADGGFNE